MFFCWFIGENHQPRCHLHARTSHQPVAVPVPLDPLLPTLLPAMRGAIEVVGIWHNLTIKHGYFRYFLHLGSVLRVMIHDISWYIPHFCGYFHWHDFLSHRFCSQNPWTKPWPMFGLRKKPGRSLFQIWLLIGCRCCWVYMQIRSATFFHVVMVKKYTLWLLNIAMV